MYYTIGGILKYPPLQLGLVLIACFFITSIINEDLLLLSLVAVSIFVYKKQKMHFLLGAPSFYNKRVNAISSLIAITPMLVSFMNLILFHQDEIEQYSEMAAIPVLGAFGILFDPSIMLMLLVFLYGLAFFIFYFFGGIGELIAKKLYGKSEHINAME